MEYFIAYHHLDSCYTAYCRCGWQSGKGSRERVKNDLDKHQRDTHREWDDSYDDNANSAGN